MHLPQQIDFVEQVLIFPKRPVLAELDRYLMHEREFVRELPGIRRMKFTRAYVTDASVPNIEVLYREDNHQATAHVRFAFPVRPYEALPRMSSLSVAQFERSMRDTVLGLIDRFGAEPVNSQSIDDPTELS